MAELRDELILDVSRALAEVDELERALDRALASASVNIDTADLQRTERLALDTAGAFDEVTEQVRLTAGEYRAVNRLIAEGEDATRAIGIVTGQVARAADDVEGSFRRVAASMDTSEDEARRLAAELARSVREADQLNADLRAVARSMDLTEDQARRFAAAAAAGASATAGANTAALGLASSWGRVQGLIVGAVAAIGIRGLIGQFRQAVDASANLAESVNAVNVVFAQGSEVILDASEVAARRYGVSSRELNEAATRVGSSLQNAGFDADEAAETFLRLQERASDTASVLNTDVNEVLVALQAALRGEFDSIERFTGGMNQAAVQAKAMSLGLVGLNEELDNQARAQGVIALFLERTARFQGDFANTADSAANRQRTLASEIENTRAKLGDALIPAFETFLDIGQRFIIDVRAMSESVRTMSGDMEAATPAVLNLADVIGGLPRGFGVLGDVIGGLGSGLVDTTQGVFGFANALRSGEGFGAAVENFEEAGAAIGGMFDTLQQRAILESYIADLKSGIDPALAFANATAATAQSNELTVESFQALARISGASDERLIDATKAMIAQGEAAGFDADEIRVLKDQLASLLDIDTGRLDFDRGGGIGARKTAAALAELEAQIAATAGASDPLVQHLEEIGRFDLSGLRRDAVALDELAAAASVLGVSLGEVFAEPSKFPELAAAIAQVPPATRDLVTATDEIFNFADAFATANQSLADEIDIFSELPDELALSKDQFLANLRVTAAEQAEFEQNLLRLFVISPELARSIQAQGISARGLLADLLTDPAAVSEAEALISGEMASLAGVTATLFSENLTSQDIPGLLDFLGQLSDPGVVGPAVGGLIAAINDALLGAGLTAPILIQPDVAFIPTAGGPSFAGPGTRAAPPSAGANVVVNFNTEPEANTDTQRISQTLAALIR